jgi:hypothetical protein
LLLPQLSPFSLTSILVYAFSGLSYDLIQILTRSF